MKTNLSRRLRIAILCLALLAAAVSFTATAQAQTEATAEKKTETEQKEELFPLVIEGELAGKALFSFRENRIEYMPQKGKGSDPGKITINGTPWEDLRTPFRLDFVTNYSQAQILERSDNVSCAWDSNHTIQPKYIDRFKYVIGQLSISSKEDTSSSFRVVIGFKKYPQSIETRIVNMYQRSPKRPQANQTQWMNQGQGFTTDGKEHPAVTMVPVPNPRDKNDRFDVTIEAMIDYNAHFTFQGSRISYIPYPDIGEYPSQVRINDKSWSNLLQPFTMEYAFDADCIVETDIETEFYQYYILPEKNNSFSVWITNHGPRKENIRIKLSLMRKDF